MPAEIKFCGLTRAEDARAAAMCGARYAGVIFAGGPRALEPAAAAMVLDATGGALARVGVFGTAEPSEVARVVRAARLDVAQLHGEPTALQIRAVRAATGAQVWAVLRVDGAADADRLDELDGEADAVVFETRVPGRLGGTGVAFDWDAAARGPRPRRSKLVVAGGLTPENVALAIAALTPHVVDVSSGVESSPGVKDHQRLRDFADAVRSVVAAR